jgi:hypothetical protein
MIINRFYCCMLGISTFAGLAAAQGAMNVTASEFVARSGRFNGVTVVISNLKIDLSAVSTTIPSGAVSPAGSGAPVPGSPAAPGPMSAGSSDIRCLPPRGFKTVKVGFPADANFTKCFFIAEAQYNALPKGQTLNAQLTFKGDSNLGYVITLFRLQ